MVPDTPESRLLWLSDFHDQEAIAILSLLLDKGFAEMILKDGKQGFRMTALGRAAGIAQFPQATS